MEAEIRRQEEEKKNTQVFVWCFSTVGTGNYEAYFGQGTKLTVLEPGVPVTSPKVAVLKPSPSQRGKKKTLVCVATDFYPDHVKVSWWVNGRERLQDVATDDAATRGDKFYRITSRLTVPVREWQNRGRTFTCVVTFFNGTSDIRKTGSVTGVKGDSKAREKYLRITQSAKLTYGTLIVKSCVYGVFVAFLVWKLQKSYGKQ